MAKRRAALAVEFTGEQAKAALEFLLSQGRVTLDHLAEARAAIDEERERLLRRLEELGDFRVAAIAGAALGAVATAAAPAIARAFKQTRGPRVGRSSAGAGKAASNKTPSADSPERIATKKLQGRYLGLMRQIPKPVVKRRFGKDAIAARGKEAVVAEMEAYLRK